MELTTESITEYVNSMKDGKSKQRKVQNALTAYKEHCKRFGLMEGTEESIASFIAENAGKWQQAETYGGYVREYYGLPKPKRKSKDKKGAEQLSVDMENTITVPSNETTAISESENITEYNEETSQNETLQHSATKRARKATGEKKVQVSVYLEPETYNVLSVLAEIAKKSVGETLSECATALAKKNESNGVYHTAISALQALRSLRVEYPE